MDLMTILGVLIGSGVIMFVLYTGQMMRFLLNPEAIILIFGGTLGSVLISYPWSALRHVPGGLMMMLRPPRRPTPQTLINVFVELAQQSLRDGTPSLSKAIATVPHPFLPAGLHMLLAGLHTSIIRAP